MRKMWNVIFTNMDPWTKDAIKTIASSLTPASVYKCFKLVFEFDSDEEMAKRRVTI